MFGTGRYWPVGEVDLAAGKSEEAFKPLETWAQQPATLADVSEAQAVR